jgi:hypothetical protein
LSNYNLTGAYRINSGSTLGEAGGLSVRQAAWVCNQTINCSGFQYRLSDGHTWWLSGKGGNIIDRDRGFGKTGDSIGTWVIDYTYNIYRKTVAPLRTVDNPDTFNIFTNTGDPSILSSGQGASTFPKFFGGPVQTPTHSVQNGSCTPLGNEPGYSFTRPGAFNSEACGESGGFNDNSMSGYFIPIGWKWMTNGDCGSKVPHLDQGNESYLSNSLDNTWHASKAEDPPPTTIDTTTYAGCYNTTINDIASSVLFEQIGFDVPTHWDDMVSSGGLTTSEQVAIQTNWCNSVTSLTTFLGNKDSSGNPRCKTTLGNEAYNKRLLTLCETSGTWTTDGSCKGAVRDSIGSGDGNHGQALTMIHTFCRGGDGSNPQGIGPGRSTTGAGSKLCGCLNANDFSFYSNPPTANCYTYPTMAGCSQVVEKTQEIVAIATGPVLSAIKTNFSDAGSLATDCVTSKQACVNSACVIPYQPDAAHTDVTINMCNFITQQEIAVNSAVSNKCSITTPGTPGAKTTTAATGSGSGPSSGSGSGPSSLPDTPILIGGGIAGFFCCILFIVIAFLLSSGD